MGRSVACSVRSLSWVPLSTAFLSPLSSPYTSAPRLRSLVCSLLFPSALIRSSRLPSWVLRSRPFLPAPVRCSVFENERRHHGSIVRRLGFKSSTDEEYVDHVRSVKHEFLRRDHTDVLLGPQALEDSGRVVVWEQRLELLY